MLETATILAPLRVTHNTDLDQLEAVPLAAVADRAGPRRWRPVSDRAAYLLDTPGGSEIGFVVQRFSNLQDDGERLEGMWGAPSFHVPTLGLRDATAGEIAIAARTFYGGDRSISQQFFRAAVSAHGDEAVALWRACLECGDLKGHYGLGCTFLDLDRDREAYRHLRYYAEINPADAWAHCYRGIAAERLGHREEAREAYLRGAEIETMSEPTDAAELLARLGLAERGDLSWVPEVLPRLTDAQALQVHDALVSEGVGRGTLRAALMPHLPLPGNGLRRELTIRHENEDATERRASLDYASYPDQLMAAVEDFVFTLAQPGDAQRFHDVLLWVDLEGTLHAIMRLQESWDMPDAIGAELRRRRADRFAFLTRDPDDDPTEVAVMFGAPPARTDVLTCHVHADGGRRRDQWREPDNDAPRVVATRIMRAWAGPGSSPES